MNRQYMRLATTTIAALALLGMTACGVSAPSGNAKNVPSATTTTQSATATTPPAATPPVTRGATLTQGQVTVTLSKTSFASSDTITVYVNNGLGTSIQVANHQTACTIVTMQQSEGATWQAVGKCRLMIMTVMKNLPALSTTVVQLGPSAGQIAQSAWPAGTYRIALYYVSSSPKVLSPAYSAQFAVR